MNPMLPAMIRLKAVLLMEANQLAQIYKDTDSAEFLFSLVKQIDAYTTDWFDNKPVATPRDLET